MGDSRTGGPHEPGPPNVNPRIRFPSGVPGLDEIIGGGFLSGGMYLVAGGPGTGKTVLANQLCFTRAREGGQCVYVTMLAESHSRMIGNLENMAFFDESVLNDNVTYLSGVRALRDEGLEGLFGLIEEEIHRRKPVLLVLDALSIGKRIANASEMDHPAFLNRLAALLEFSGCTAVISTLSRHGIVALEHALADGLLELTQTRIGMRSVRELFVCKLRGSAMLEGGHVFEIGEQGVVVYPRTEARLTRPRRIAETRGDRLSCGIERFDEMMGGGIQPGSATALIGPTGSGKTLLGLHFLAEGARNAERGLYFGFYESPERIVAEGDRVGLGLTELCDSGRFDVSWHRPFENLLDRLTMELLDHVQGNDIKRLYIDGIEGLTRGAMFPERVPVVLAALINELRALGVTTLMSVEGELLGTTPVPAELWSALAENAVVLRYVEVRSRLRRLMWIVKVRGSAFETALREFTITDDGIDILEQFEPAEAILTGAPRLDDQTGADPAKGRGG